jgi:hypothetical protein
VYGVALARRLGLQEDAVERVATAARLHHIGYVTLDDPQDATYAENQIALAHLSGEILRETEFLAEVGELVEAVHDDDKVVTREAGVVRVATMFDHLVLEDVGRAAGALELVSFAQKNVYGAAAVHALREALDDDPGLIYRAIASGAPLTEAASASEAASDRAAASEAAHG